MRKIVILTVVAAVLLSTAALAGNTPKGSFLNTTVTNVKQLAQEVIDDAIVAARYAKHYQTPRNTVVDYFQNNLRVGKLKAEYEVTVYTITEGTTSIPTKKLLQAGSYVLVTPDGKPFLEASTGNPLSDSLPLVIVENPNEKAAAVVSGSMSNSASTVPGLAAVPPTEGVITKVLGTEPIEIASSVTAVTEIVPAIPASAVNAAKGTSKLASALPVAALVGGAALAGGDGSSPAPPSDSVPEPGSMMVLTFAVSALAIWKIRRRS